MKQVIDIFSLYRNARLYVEKGKNINLDKPVHPIVFERTKPHLQTMYRKVWNGYANFLFTYEELKLYILHEYLFRTDVNVINTHDREQIKKVSSLFTEERFEKDKEILLILNDRFRFKSIENFFRFTEDGENVVFRLTLKRTLSPMFYAKYIDKVNDENTNEKYIRFARIIKQISKTMEIK